MRLIHAFLGAGCFALGISACSGDGSFNEGPAVSTDGGDSADPTPGDSGAPTMSGGGSRNVAGSAQTGGSGVAMGGQPQSDAGAPSSAGVDSGGEAGAGGAPTPPECASAADCDAKLGAAACGKWQCAAGACAIDSPNCTDLDRDGYGVGAQCACAGLDCDDSDDTVADTEQKSCYTGANGTLGVGTCQAGQANCAAGVWGPCIGEVTPGGEACNGLDDDCNKAADDALGHFTCGLGACTKTIAACVNGAVSKCVPLAPVSANDATCNGVDDDCDGAIDEDCTCVHVAPTGDDVAAAADKNTTAFRNIQAGIDWAVANPSGPQRVCVASGAACNTSFTYASAQGATVTMANGVSVYGRYESATWTNCPTSTTIIQPQTAAGVTFPSSVTTATVLDGFRVDRAATGTTSAVTIDGAKNAILSNVYIINTPAVTNSYGVNLINGASATIARSKVDAGTGSAESIGVRAVGATVAVVDNCLSPDPNTGRCDDFCGNNPAIRGRTTTGTGTTYGVLLDNAPGSKVERSALCSNTGDIGAIIRVTGNAQGLVIRGNAINAFGGAQDSHGIWLEDCGGAAPWIVDNNYIAAAGTSQQTRVDAIRSIGDCHPVIDRNVAVTGGGEGQASNPTAVHCAASKGVASRCVVDGNLSLRGSEQGFPPVAAGVRCESGSCVKITQNTITGRGGVISYGVWLGQTGAFVGNNTIRGGCASTTAVGVYTEDSWARLENDRISGYVGTDCVNNQVPQNLSKSYGLQVFMTLGNNELDVHSNLIDGAGTASGTCSSWAAALDVTGTPPTAAAGIFRNNIFRGGSCSKARSTFSELAAATDPRIFEHNDFDPANNPTQLYLDEAATGLNTAAAVNALIDMTTFGNVSVDPEFVSYPTDVHLKGTSLCIAAGTPNGAPAKDMDGDARDPNTPDIGPDEH